MTAAEERLADALAIQLCSVVRSEARFTGPPRPSLRGIPPNAIAVTALTPAYAKKFRGTCLPDLVRGLRLSKLSVLLRDERLSGCVSVAVDEDNNQLMVWPRTRGPCACARDVPGRVRAHSEETWDLLWAVESVGRVERQLDPRGMCMERSPAKEAPSGAAAGAVAASLFSSRAASPVSVVCEDRELQPRSLIRRFEDAGGEAPPPPPPPPPLSPSTRASPPPPPPPPPPPQSDEGFSYFALRALGPVLRQPEAAASQSPYADLCGVKPLPPPTAYSTDDVPPKGSGFHSVPYELWRGATIFGPSRYAALGKAGAA